VAPPDQSRLAGELINAMRSEQLIAAAIIGRSGSVEGRTNKFTERDRVDRKVSQIS
jgi:hypothetical protein